MDLQELKQKSPPDLLKFAEELEIENASALTTKTAAMTPKMATITKADRRSFLE